MTDEESPFHPDRVERAYQQALALSREEWLALIAPAHVARAICEHTELTWAEVIEALSETPLNLEAMFETPEGWTALAAYVEGVTGNPFAHGPLVPAIH